MRLKNSNEHISPRVSVIMPVYNAEKFLDNSIKSVLNQTFTDFEFLIIDDASSDSSLQIIESYSDSRIRLFKNNTNLGSLKSRNRLFTECKGEFLIFQDADDFSSINRFQILVQYLVENQAIYLCGSNARYFDHKGREKFTSNKLLNSEQIKIAFKSEIPIVCASTIVRSEVLKSIGGYKEYFYDLGNYDYDWMYRISDKFLCANLPDVLYYVHRRDGSNSLTFVNPYKIIGQKIVQFLGHERENKSKDSLELNNMEKIKAFSEKAYLPYKKDSSLYLYDIIVGLMGEEMYSEAQKMALKAIKINFTVRNIRSYFYILRKRAQSKFKRNVL